MDPSTTPVWEREKEDSLRQHQQLQHPPHHRHLRSHSLYDTRNDTLKSTDIVTTTFFCISPTNWLPSPYHHARFPSIPDNLSITSPTTTFNSASTDLDKITPPSSVASPISPRFPFRRSLTHNDAMTSAILSFTGPPDSPPDFTNSMSSKSSKSSSFRSHSSYTSGDGLNIHNDVDIAHFEEIGLDDQPYSNVEDFQAKTPNPLNATYELRSKPKRQTLHSNTRSGMVGHANGTSRELTNGKRPGFPSLSGPVKQAKEGSSFHSQNQGLGLMPMPISARRGFTSPSTPTLSSSLSSNSSQYKRNRSPSPASTLSTHSLSEPQWTQGLHVSQRRGSWHANRERKTQKDLERECEEDDGDDLPDGFVLEGVPISPRTMEERLQTPILGLKALSPQTGPLLNGHAIVISEPSSPERSQRSPKERRFGEKKEKVKPAGNGTPLLPVEQGSLRSPAAVREDSSGKRDSSPANTYPIPQRGSSMQFPINHDAFQSTGRAKSWTAALSGLSEETKSLTDALEAHAGEQGRNGSSSPSYPNSWFSNPTKPRSRSSSRSIESPGSNGTNTRPKLRVQSSLAELPPLRRTDIMIDPLPISKEKEAVLSRTRPSWLPPKNPAEEKRHLKEYQRMMAAAEKRKESEATESRLRQETKDDVAGSLSRIWEEHVIPNWNHVIEMKRTRELWWRGIAPRSRGLVWSRAISNELELSANSYHAALSRAKDLERRLASHEGTEEEERSKASIAAIRQDVENTYPDLRIFQHGGPLHEPLIDVLMAYAMYRSDVGYVFGTNTIAALLLLNLPSAAASFLSLANALNRPLPMSFLTRDYAAISRVHSLTLQTLAAKLPRLYAHLCRPNIGLNVDPSPFLDSMFESLFTNTVTLDAATRLWDVWVFEGDAVLVRAAVGVLGGCESGIYGCESLDEVLAVVRESRGGLGVGEAGKGTREGEEAWMERVREAGRNGVVGSEESRRRGSGEP